MKKLNFCFSIFFCLFTFSSIGQEILSYEEIENKPYLAVCEGDDEEVDKDWCTRVKLVDFIYENIKYPASSQKKGFFGKVLIRFTIKNDGTIADAKVIENVNDECDAAALQVFQSMNEKGLKWTPATVADKKVDVYMDFPVAFGTLPVEPIAFRDEGVIYKDSDTTASDTSKEQTFVVVEEMPMFPGCGDEATDEEKQKCTEKALLTYMYQNITYPVLARENGIEGLVVLQFIVDKNGAIHDIVVLRGIGGGCDAEAVRVIKGMTDAVGLWIPGKQKGKAVQVRYNLPIRFKLAINDGPPPITAFDKVEQPPIFPPCMDKEPSSQLDCTKKAVIDYLQEQLIYPQTAKDNKVEGTVLASFVITEFGSVVDIKILESLDRSCDAAAIQAINSMNLMSTGWQPAKQNGQRIKVQYTVPIKFEL